MVAQNEVFVFTNLVWRHRHVVPVLGDLHVSSARAVQLGLEDVAPDVAHEVEDRTPVPVARRSATSTLRAMTGRPPARTTLTPTERQVIDLVGQGLSNAEVGERLKMVPEAVVDQP